MSRTIAVLGWLGLSCFPWLAFPQEDQKPPKDATVWVIDDTDKVHPVTGKLLSEGLPVYTGKTPSAAEYRRRNHVWDAAANTIRLHSGRNEFVSFQLILEKGKQNLHKVFVNATDLLGAKERISADSHIRMFKEHFVAIDGVWHPDALVPFELGGTTPIELPEPAGNVPGQRVQAIWVDIYVPHAQAPGAYTGDLIVVHRGSNKQAILKIELEVGDFTLPDELGLDVDLMNYGFLNIERGWPDLIQDSPRHRAIEREFFRMAHAHRMTFAIVPYNHDGSIPKGLKPELAGVGEGIRVADWKSWDERFGPYLTGEAFADLPRRGKPVDHFFLPYNLMWPSDFRFWQKPEYRTEHLRISAEFRKHLAAKGWTKPQYHVYYNNKEGYLFSPWNLDEPTRPKDREALSYLGKILNESFPDNDPVKILLRLDIGHFHCETIPQCKSQFDAGGLAAAALNPFVQLWNIGNRHYWANMPEVRKLKSQGKTMYFYTGTPRVPNPLMGSVLWGWFGYKYEADGVCYWNATNWTDWDTDGPALDPYLSPGGRDKGFSMFLYPGSKFGYDGPIPSVRLKAMRRGFQDFEYLRMIEKSGKKSRQELVRLADELLDIGGPYRDPAELPGPKADYPKLRRLIFEMLAGR